MSNQKTLSIAAAGIAVSAFGILLLSTSPLNKKEDKTLITKILEIHAYSKVELAGAFANKAASLQVLKNQAFADEFTFQQIEKDLLVPIEKQFLLGESRDFSLFFSPQDATVKGLDIRPSTLVDERDGIKRLAWKNSSEVNFTQSDFKNYSQVFSMIEDFRIDIKTFDILMSDRREADSKALKMKLAGFMEIKGQASRGEIRHDVGRVELVVSRHEESRKKWKIEKIIFHDFTTLISNRLPAFTDVTDKIFEGKGPAVYLRREALRSGHSMAIFDANQDGLLDMHIGLARDSELWTMNPKTSQYVKNNPREASMKGLNKLDPYQENADIKKVAALIGLTDVSNITSVAAGDFNNDGLIDYALTTLNLNAASRFNNTIHNHFHLEEGPLTNTMGSFGLRLFQQTKNKTFTEVTTQAGLEFSGEATAGVAFLDYNNDGLLDLYVTNGLWSGNDRFQDASYFLVNPMNAGPAMMSNAAFISLLINFKGDLFAPNLRGHSTLSVAGFQHNKLFRNNGDGTFIDVGYIEGVDNQLDGHMVIARDLDRDGKVDLILRNSDPIERDHSYPVVQVFHNTLNWDTQPNHLSFKNTHQ